MSNITSNALKYICKHLTNSTIVEYMEKEKKGVFYNHKTKD